MDRYDLLSGSQQVASGEIRGPLSKARYKACCLPQENAVQDRGKSHSGPPASEGVRSVSQAAAGVAKGAGRTRIADGGQGVD